MFSRAVPALHPDKDLFVLLKAFASGVILATGYMHVLPDSFISLRSECLPETPWKKFPFTTFVAMLSAVATLMVDSFSMSYYYKRRSQASLEDKKHHEIMGQELEDVEHGLKIEGGVNEKSSSLLRHRVVAQV